VGGYGICPYDEEKELKMDITIDVLEKYLLDRYGGWANEQGLFLKLVEELGEVAEVINMRAGSKKAIDADLQKELGVELADMLHYLVAIAAINQIDLTSIILEKDRKASVKYHHDVNLETFISKGN
jgi:NTP pyrophosphatase (non-canonical NTP hydrolase)